MPIRDRVRFILDGEVVELTGLDPTRTVLQFLREDRGRVGTKEGCAEGDCGACTVVVVAPDARGDSLTVRAVNACIQFLATLDGKELITVESLAGPGGELHPVQQAMLEEHGSQCGFCTPGFVMSLFALFKNEAAPGRVDIDNALAGNLCRCTGYRPIIAAAGRMYELGDTGDWLTAPAGESTAARERLARLRALSDDQDIVIGDGVRTFMAPASSASLARLLAEHPGATLLAGGTDVGLWVTKAQRTLDPVIYLGRVAELSAIVADDAAMEFGAGVTLSDAVPVLVEKFPALEELFLRWASPPIRNAATLAGNIANGSPIGDSMPVLMALGTELVLRSAGGVRTLPLEDYYLDYGMTARRDGEFIERVRVPLPPDGTVVRSYKISKRFDQDISALCLGACLELHDGVARNVRLAWGGMAATIRRAGRAEAALEGRPLDDAAVDAAMRALREDLEPISDLRASGAYRLRVAQNLLKRLQLDVAGKPSVSLYAHGRAY